MRGHPPPAALFSALRTGPAPLGATFLCFPSHPPRPRCPPGPGPTCPQAFAHAVPNTCHVCPAWVASSGHSTVSLLQAWTRLVYTLLHLLVPGALSTLTMSSLCRVLSYPPGCEPHEAGPLSMPSRGVVLPAVDDTGTLWGWAAFAPTPTQQSVWGLAQLRYAVNSS